MEANEGVFSPSDYAQAYYEQHGAELDERTKKVFENYRWQAGELIVKCEYAPENEETRVYYIVALNEKEVLRCKHESAITSFFEMLDEVSVLRDRCKELEEEIARIRKPGLFDKIFNKPQ